MGLVEPDHGDHEGEHQLDLAECPDLRSARQRHGDRPTGRAGEAEHADREGGAPLSTDRGHGAGRRHDQLRSVDEGLEAEHDRECQERVVPGGAPVE